MRAVCDIAIMLWETCFDDNEKDLVKSFLLSVARVDEGIMRRFAIEGICKILVWYGDHKASLLGLISGGVNNHPRNYFEKCWR